MFNPQRLNARVVAPIVHVGLFVLLWGLNWRRDEPLPGNPGFWIYFLLCVMDLPISAIVPAIVWFLSPAPALVWGLWLVLGTAWWIFLGQRIDKWRTNRTGSMSSKSN